MNRFPMTRVGEARLREELDQLKKVDRPRIVQAIAEARAHGDLKENAEYHETVTYRIVGEDEADIKDNLISVGSPIARALIGKEEGDVVVVKAPGGDIEYEIDQVHHI